VSALVAARCTTSTITTVEPSPVKCDISLSPTSASVGASSAVVNFTVTGAPECEWVPTPSAGATWIIDVMPAAGQGSGKVSFRTTANTGPERSGTVAIVDRAFTVNQASGCTYSINPTSQQIASAGGSAAVAVTSGAGCTWSATSNATFVSVTQGATGSGNGSVTFNVQANTGPQRSGTLTIAGRVFTVTQDNGCIYTIAPVSRAFTGAGGTDSVAVTTAAGCTWTTQVAADSLSWLAITAGGSGSGNGTVQYIVASLFFGSRTGTITIAGRTFTVMQQS
jgi:hypothetical protein